MTEIEAAGGVLYLKSEDEVQVLLILRNGIWDLPKGKKEYGETWEECALREVSEEVGVIQPEIRNELCTTYHEYTGNGEEFGKTTRWYGMTSDHQMSLNPQTDEGITDLKWVPVPEAIERVGYENLVNVLKAFEASCSGREDPDQGV